jgi:hypothetical protein
MEEPTVLKSDSKRPMAIIAGICSILGASGVLAKEAGLIFTLLLSIVAIVLGVKARKDARIAGENSTYATGALVIGIIFTIVNSVKIIFWVLVLVALFSAF